MSEKPSGTLQFDKQKNSQVMHSLYPQYFEKKV